MCEPHLGVPLYNWNVPLLLTRASVRAGRVQFKIYFWPGWGQRLPELGLDPAHIFKIVHVSSLRGNYKGTPKTFKRTCKHVCGPHCRVTRSILPIHLGVCTYNFPSEGIFVFLWASSAFVYWELLAKKKKSPQCIKKAMFPHWISNKKCACGKFFSFLTTATRNIKNHIRFVKM